MVYFFFFFLRTSLEVQWLRIHLSIQGVRVQSLVRRTKDPTCHEATMRSPLPECCKEDPAQPKEKKKRKDLHLKLGYNPLQYSYLVKFMDRKEPGRLRSMGSQSQTRTCMHATAV